MRTYLLHMGLLITFALFLLFPAETLNGAADGLILWYNVLLPNLLPFIIITTLIIRTEAYLLISKWIGGYVGKFFSVSKEGSIAIIIGFLCGYPMGAKTINDLYEQSSISETEAQYLLSFCNNTSPMFIIGFFVLQILDNQSILIPAMLAIYLAPITMSCLTRRYYRLTQSFYTRNCSISEELTITSKASKVKLSFSLLDEVMIDSIILIMKIGGYIMLFSIFIHLSLQIAIGHLHWIAYVIPLLEVTNGLVIYQSIDNNMIQYLAMIFLVSFGGLCAIGQTSCVIVSNKIKIAHYFIQKIITAIIAVIISVVILILSGNIRL